MIKRPPVWAVKNIGAIAAVAATIPAPLFSAQAFASPSTPVVPRVPQRTQPPIQPPVQQPPAQHTQPPAQPPVQQAPAQHSQPPVQAPVQETPPHTQVHSPSPIATPTSQTPAPPTPAAQPPTAQAPATKAPVTVPTTTNAASEPPVTTGPARPTTSAPAVAGSPTPGHSAAVTTGPTLVVSGGSPTSSPRITAPGQQTAVVTQRSSTTTVPVATTPRGIPVSDESVQAARVAPAATVTAAAPRPVRGNFNEQVQAAVKINVDHDVDVYRPRHWDYLDYDQYHRPAFYNPLATDMSFRYFYNGEYQTVLVPAGGRVLLNVEAVGVFPYTAVAGDYVAVGSFYGGAWVPPVGWIGPPPADWQPWQPVVYTAIPVDFAEVGQTVLVDRVTMVGHDDSLPAGQQDLFMLNDSTLARGDVQPSPDGGPPQVTLQQSQQLPGVGPWDNGQQDINTAIQKPPAPSHNRLPWVIGGLAAVLALLAGVVAWVWKHPRGDHAWANAPTDLLSPYSPNEWTSSGGAHTHVRANSQQF